jgi:hypothetical protein
VIDYPPEVREGEGARKPVYTELPIIHRDTMKHPDDFCHHLPIHPHISDLDSTYDRCLAKPSRSDFLLDYA